MQSENVIFCTETVQKKKLLASSKKPHNCRFDNSETSALCASVILNSYHVFGSVPALTCYYISSHKSFELVVNDKLQ